MESPLKNQELSQRLESLENWEKEVQKSRVEIERAEIKRTEVEVKLDAAKIQVNQLKNKLHESVSQVVALTYQLMNTNRSPSRLWRGPIKIGLS